MTDYSIYTKTVNEDYIKSYYEDIEIPFDDNSDYYITIDSKYNQKPGLLALDMYGSERLAWVFYYFNKDKMEDIIFDLTTGKRIRVPMKSRLLKYF